MRGYFELFIASFCFIAAILVGAFVGGLIGYYMELTCN